MLKNLGIFALEMDCKWMDKESNLAHLEFVMSKLPEGVDIVVLPEMFSTGFIINDKKAIENLAEKNSGNTIRRIEKLSQEHNVAIIGTFMAYTSGIYSNRAFFVEPSGDTYFYDKHHLFSIGNETALYSAGKTLPNVVRFRGWNIMPVICYDLRFPEWCRNTNNKYDLLIVMANWPKVREYSWRHLLIARAIENQCYVCGVNRTGIDDNGIEYPIDSTMIIDVKGENITQSLKKLPNIKLGMCDRVELVRFREKFPAWKDADNFILSL